MDDLSLPFPYSADDQGAAEAGVDLTGRILRCYAYRLKFEIAAATLVMTSVNIEMGRYKGTPGPRDILFWQGSASL